MATEFKNPIAQREAQKLQPFLMPLLRKAIQNLNKIEGDFYTVAQQTAREFSGTYTHTDITRIAFALEVWYDHNFDEIKKPGYSAASLSDRLAKARK